MYIGYSNTIAFCTWDLNIPGTSPPQVPREEYSLYVVHAQEGAELNFMVLKS